MINKNDRKKFILFWNIDSLWYIKKRDFKSKSGLQKDSIKTKVKIQMWNKQNRINIKKVKRMPYVTFGRASSAV
jgi:hypothetical protein